jgi:ATP-dependent helicase/nuclease subunit B
MPVQFVIGRAGSGKTAFCIERISQAIRAQPLGPPIYWLLPRQATFIAERELAATTELGGYFRARVLSFEDLGTEILGECGGIALPEVTSLGRRMILGHLLRQLQTELRFFRSVATQPGVAAELDGAFSELERAGHDATTIANELDQKPTSPALAAKLHDVSLIYSRYAQFLGKDRLDPNHRLSSALAAVAQCRSLKQADIYIDSFHEFTGSERKVIAALAKAAKSVTLTLTLDPESLIIANPHHNPDEMSLFHGCEETYRRLVFSFSEERVALEPPVALKQSHRFKNSQLLTLESHLFSSPGIPGKSKGGGRTPDGSIYLVSTSDPQSEVDAAARWIRKLVTDGLRYRDIVILMRDQHDYQHHIESSFREHNIPFFVDRRRSASHHPLLRLIRAVLAVATTNWSHNAMMAVIKTDLVGLSYEDADALENYVLLHGIDHTTWTQKPHWTGRRSRASEFESAEAFPDIDEAAKMDALRRPLMARLEPLAAHAKSKSTTVRSLASTIFQLLESFQCRQRIVTWMEAATAGGNLEERAEHERVWDELVKLFDEMVSLFGDEQISLADFSAILDSALEGFDLALTPPTVDQVLVGAVDRTRMPPVKACAVLGLSEGQFPRAISEDSIFTDSDRRILASSKFDLDPDSARRLLDEDFLGYLAMTRASNHLLLTRSTTDKVGKTKDPSPFWTRVLTTLPDVKESSIARHPDLPLKSISTPRQLVDALMRWVRDGAKDATWNPIYQWFASHAPNDDSLSTARSRAWKALSHQNEARLQPVRASALFPSPLNTNPHRLESFRECPYQHFARYGLNLRQREERQVNERDLSRVFHEVLQRLVGELIKAKQSWPDLDEADTKSRLSRLTAQLGKQLRDELMLSSARNRYLLSHVERTLALVAGTQKAAAERGSFRPAFLDVRYGPGEKLPTISVRTPAGNETLLSGKIDRIDVLPDGSACAIDYRLHAPALNAAGAYHGLSLQLLTCLLLLEKNGRHLYQQGKITPAAAFCVQLLRSVQRDDPETAPAPDDPQFHLRTKPRGLFDHRIAKSLDNNLAEGMSEVVHLFIKKDGSVGRANTTDSVPTEQFEPLLRHIERRIGDLADQIIAGKIDIHPYRIGTETPCPNCEFRSLCRLEPNPGCYDDLEMMSREELFDRIAQESRGAK